jgi:hypothetical protein
MVLTMSIALSGEEPIAAREVSEDELAEAVGQHRNGVTFIKARLAFNSFKVVKNKLGFRHT